jgi:NADH ubiquinone oxidoreductase, 20 Kd subunit
MPDATREAQSPITEIDVLWVTAGLGCDGDTIAMTAATQPSIEDVLMGALPWIPKVHLHNPFLAIENGDEFLKPFHLAPDGELAPFILVVEGSIPDEHNKAEGYWASWGTDAKTGQPILTCEWIDRLAPKAWAVVAAGTCANLRVVRVRNVSPLDNPEDARREQALMRSLISAHVILGADGGHFVSLFDPPEELRGIAALCRNVGVFPVLVGEEGQRDIMLSSPIILYDYPQIAPESAGDLFDGTEIDEILSLRIMTMTDEEKLEMRQSDERARQLLERTETLPKEHLMKLHGVLRGLRPVEEESR